MLLANNKVANKAIKDFNFEIFPAGLITRTTPKNPNEIANHLLQPTFSCKKNVARNTNKYGHSLTNDSYILQWTFAD